MGTAPQRTQEMIDNNDFYVEMILAERIGRNRRSEYLVKWEGFPPEEASWEPRRNVHSNILFDWLAQRQLQQELDQMDVDDDRRSESDDEDVVLPQRSSEPQQTSPAASDSHEREEFDYINPSADEGEVDEEVEDATNQVSQSPAPAIEDQPTNIATDMGEDAAGNHHQGACNDLMSTQLGVDEHRFATRVCEDPNHVNNPTTRTCERCLNAARETFSADQQDVFENGALFALCHDCAEIHLDENNANLHFPCECFAKPQCCWCLLDAVDRLAEANKETSRATATFRCLECPSLLDGFEKTLKCASCKGLKVVL